MGQSALGAEFKRNAAQQTLTSQQTSQALSLGAEAASVLRADEARDFVDPAVPKALEQLAEPLRRFVPVGNEPATYRPYQQRYQHFFVIVCCMMMRRTQRVPSTPFGWQDP